MKTFSIFALFLGLATSAEAKFDPDFLCEVDGGGVAFKVGSESTARVWQTDPDLPGEGLAFTVTEFIVDSQPGSFYFEAHYKEHFSVRGTVEDFMLKYEYFDPSKDRWRTLKKGVECLPQ